MPRSTSHDDFLLEILKDKGRASAYLDAAFDDPDPRIFLIALRNVTLARGGGSRGCCAVRPESREPL